MIKSISLYIKMCIILFLFIGQVIAQKASGITELFPAETEMQGWQVKDSIEVYEAESLFSYINGGADVYLEYGFDEVGSCNYINENEETIHAEIYRMKSSDAAYGIFTMNSSKSGIPVELGSQAMDYDYYLDIWKDNFYFRFTSNQKSEELKAWIRKIALIVIEKTPNEGGKPLLHRVFDGFDSLKEIKYVKGKIALGNVYRFGHGTIAGFSDGIVGRTDEFMIFVFAYENEKECKEWVAAAKGKMQMNKRFSNFALNDEGFTLTDKSGSPVCFKSYRKHFLVVKDVDWDAANNIFSVLQENIDLK